jgi:chromosome segregation ATPase
MRCDKSPRSKDCWFNLCRYTKYAKEFKQELDLKRKDYEQYSKLRTSIGQYETKLAEIKEQITQSLAKKEQLDGEMREIERDLHKIQGVESEYTYL